ncbi:MAG: HK97 gp10 family phage protein [Bacilli bacterium]|nr:HK97 gp10 family phage protein [Bacilli bacterium]
MSSNNNGFQEMLDYTTRLAQVNIDKVSIESLENAASFFVEKLLPNIPKSLMNKKHMKDHVKIEIGDDRVTVYFEDTSFYWRFIENGTSIIQAEHFVEGTWQQHKETIQDIMSNELLKEMKG